MPQVNFRGRFLWHELLTTDPKAAVKFYTKVTGWTTKAWEENSSYLMWMTETGPVGGVLPLPDEAKAMNAPPHWLPYIGTPDIDATVDAAVRLGAKVIKGNISMPSVGRWAVMADPAGAVFAPFTPASAPMQQSDTPQVGHFSWHELATTDGAAGFAFYEQLFGWQKTDAMDMGPGGGVYQMFGWGGKSMGGIYKPTKESGIPPHWMSYVHVRDTNKAVEAINKGGGKIVNGPMEVPGGDLIAVAKDPQGGAFAVHSLNPAAAAKAKAPGTPAKAGKT